MSKARALVVAGALALLSLGTTVTPAGAAPGCDPDAVCLWSENNGGGQLLVWKGGYLDLPPGLHDHVYSFRANRNACFINYNEGTKEVRTAHPGDYADNYDEGFGAEMDAISDTPC